MNSLRTLLAAMMPPVLWRVGKQLTRRLRPSVDHFQYAPAGWATSLPANDPAAWTDFMGRELVALEHLVSRVRAGQDVLSMDADERLKYLTFGYVLAQITRPQQQLTVLDYGGNLGDYYWLAQALVPGIDLDYHCKELPAVAAIGREVNPAVTWQTDDGCLDQSRDLVMFGSSLQYLPEWQAILRRAAQSCRYLLLSDVPTVQQVHTYVATQRSRGLTNVYGLLNRLEIILEVERSGLTLVREFPMGAHPAIAGAPEQPTCVGWLFERSRP